MPNAITNIQTLAAHLEENKTFYERTLLSRLLPNLHFYEFCQKRTIPNNEGDTINFRRFNSLPAATTPLEEGKPGEGLELSISVLTAQLKQYGSYIPITDKFKYMAIDQIMTELAEMLGEQAGLTLDTLLAQTFASGTNVQYAGGVVGTDNIAAANVITGADVKKAVRTLKARNVRGVENGFFIGIIHPYAAHDLRENDNDWQDVSKYNGGTQIIEGEIGKIHGVRFLESSNAPFAANGNGIPVYKTCIFGQDAVGAVDLAAQTAKPSIIIKDFGSAGSGDPLNQVATAGWKMAFTSLRLQEDALVRIESSSSAA